MAAMSQPRLSLRLGARFSAALLTALLVLWGDHAILTQGPGASSLLFGGALAVFGFAGLSEGAGFGRKAADASSFETALDYAADKTLIACALLALSATLFSRDLVVVAVLLLARDIVVLGLGRAVSHAGAPAAPGDRLLTAIVMAGLGATLLLQTLLMIGVGSGGESGFSPASLLYWLTQAALWGATLLSIWTGGRYLRDALASR